MRRQGIKPSARTFWRAMICEGKIAAAVAVVMTVSFLLFVGVAYPTMCWALWEVHGVWQWDPALWPELIQGSGRI